MNLPPDFNQQFCDEDGLPLSGGKLYTYISGTVTPQTSYSDESGTTNTNPITLDAAGRCDLWLNPALVYTLVLKDSNLNLIKTWDDVAGSALATDVVTSVNTQTGDVVLASEDIPFTTETSTDWFAGTDVNAALDNIINRVDTGISAGSVAIADIGGYYTGTSVEAALQEVGAKAIPSQTGNAGKSLQTDGTNLAWGIAGAGTSTQASTGTITFPGGLIMKWGSTGTLPIDSAGNVVTFAAAFPNSCFNVQVNAGTDNSVGGGTQYGFGIFNITAAGFKINNDAAASIFYYFAIGN